MRAHEFIIERKVVRRDGPPITLRWLNKLKHNLRKKQEATAKRNALLPIMYGKGDYHEEQLKKIERETEMISLEKERIELEQEKAKLAALRAEKSLETDNAIKRMSRSAMRERRKKKY